MEAIYMEVRLGWHAWQYGVLFDVCFRHVYSKCNVLLESRSMPLAGSIQRARAFKMRSRTRLTVLVDRVGQGRVDVVCGGQYADVDRSMLFAQRFHVPTVRESAQAAHGVALAICSAGVFRGGVKGVRAGAR